MSKAVIFFIALASLFTVGCSLTPTKVNTGSVKGKTFNFIDGGSAVKPDIADKRELVHQSIQSSITKTLAGKGLAKVSAKGDVTVAYLVIVGDNVSTEAIGQYFGYSEDSTALEAKAHNAYTSSKNPNAFKAGTLLIDIIDGKSFKLLQRNYSVRPLAKSATPEELAVQIQSAVDEIFTTLRVAP